MKGSPIRLAAVLTTLTLLASCATAGRDTAIGAGVGGALGAGVGALAGGKKGALIGLGVGALAGGSVGLYLDKQRKDLEKVAQVKQTENGLLVQMASDILFDVDSAVLKPEAVDQISKVGDVIAKYKDDRVRIEGHTDSAGATAYNEELSLKRADAVKRVLLSRGVQEPQMLVLGLGETKPVADNADRGRAVQEPARRAAHRRPQPHLSATRGPVPRARRAAGSSARHRGRRAVPCTQHSSRAPRRPSGSLDTRLEAVRHGRAQAAVDGHSGAGRQRRQPRGQRGGGGELVGAPAAPGRATRPARPRPRRTGCRRRRPGSAWSGAVSTSASDEAGGGEPEPPGRVAGHLAPAPGAPPGR